MVFNFSGKLLFSFSWYASISTSDSVYVIGGLTYRPGEGTIVTSTIARYKNGWKHINNLKMARSSAYAIQYGDKVMVIGGRSDRDGFDDP